MDIAGTGVSLRTKTSVAPVHLIQSFQLFFLSLGLASFNMALRFCFSLLVVLGFAASPALAETLKLDKESSKLGFVGAKAEGTHEGGFKEFTSSVEADWENPANGKISIEIKTASLWSDNDKLTNHLKNPDFFDVRKHPKITFQSTKIVPGEEGKGNVVGKLTLLGKTEELTVPVEAKMENDKLYLKAKFKLDRTKWGMTYGEGNIDKEVEITADLCFVKG
jgi:polyisoprenoid-binding protein YceI